MLRPLWQGEIPPNCSVASRKVASLITSGIDDRKHRGVIFLTAASTSTGMYGSHYQIARVTYCGAVSNSAAIANLSTCPPFLDYEFIQCFTCVTGLPRDTGLQEQSHIVANNMDGTDQKPERSQGNDMDHPDVPQSNSPESKEVSLQQAEKQRKKAKKKLQKLSAASEKRGLASPGLSTYCHHNHGLNLTPYSGMQQAYSTSAGFLLIWYKTSSFRNYNQLVYFDNLHDLPSSLISESFA